MAYNNDQHFPAYPFRHAYPTRANFPTYGPHLPMPNPDDLAMMPYDRAYARGARRGGRGGFRGGRGKGSGGRGGARKNAGEIIKNNRAKRVASKSPIKAANKSNKKNKSSNPNPNGPGPSNQTLYQSMSNLEDRIEDAVAKVYGLEEMGEGTKTKLAKAYNIRPEDLDLFLGAYAKILPNLDARSNFKKSIIKFTKNPKLVVSKDINFPKIKIGENERVRHMFIKFGDWFQDEVNAGKNAEKTGQENIALLAFSSTHKKIETAVSEIIAHYNPSGIIYFIIESGQFSESMVSMFASMNKHICIQLNGRGRKPLEEVPEEERPGVFGTRIHQIARFYRSYEGGETADLETKADEIYDL